jgi:hypothetical protein
MSNRVSGKCLVFAAVLCLPMLGKCQALTGLNLRAYCSFVSKTHLSNEEYTQKNICLFYVSGVVDGFQVGEGVPRICVPQEATVNELALVVSKYLDRFPEKLHNQPVYLVIDAIATAFPCQASPPEK